MFRFKQFAIKQIDQVHKVGTDSIMLGSWVNASAVNRVLDIGTGTGVLALMMAQRFVNASVDAVDIQSQAAELAEENFSSSPFAARLKAHCVDAAKHQGEYYDLIVCNPPYFPTSKKAPPSHRQTARHQVTMDFDSLCRGATSKLAAQGQFNLVIPFSLVNQLMKAAECNGLFMQRHCEVHSFAHKTPIRSLVCLGKEQVQSEVTQLTIYTTPDQYSDAFRALCQPFYLNF